MKEEELESTLATDRDVDVTAGKRYKCYTGRTFHGILPDFTSPVPSFSLENQKLGRSLATDKDVYVTLGERDKGYIAKPCYGVSTDFIRHARPTDITE